MLLSQSMQAYGMLASQVRFNSQADASTERCSWTPALTSRSER
jgi:hypothetical protein